MRSKPKIIIIGANFAGLAAAGEIGAFAEVRLIDPAEFFEFIPNIHELVSSEKTPSDLRIEKAELIRKMGHQYLQNRVVSLQADENRIELDNGEKLSYDACILAIGGVNNFRKVSGARQFAYPFKSVEDCQKIGERVQSLRQAQKPSSIVIVGGGSEGVEALGELLRFRNDGAPLSIHLVESENQLLPSLSSKVSAEILHICKNLPVNFHLGLGVKEVRQDSVQLSDGSILESDLTIWTGGVKPNPLLHEAGLASSAESWAGVSRTLQSTEYDNVFVAGDAAAIRQLDSKQAYFAIESGQVAGINAARYLQADPIPRLRSFYPISRPYLYSFGDLSCFLIYGSFVMAGTPLSVLKEGIYQKTMIDMQTQSSCFRLIDLYDQLLPTLTKELRKGFDTFFESPLDFLYNPPIRIL